MKHYILYLGLGLLLFSCKTADDDGGQPKDFVLEHQGLPSPNLPGDNILSHKGVDLGRHLFYDKLLSEDKTMSCASCHVQEHAFSDTNQFSTGVKGLKGKRQAMAIFNMAWNTNGFFWDGRAEYLREQALMPIQDHLEMNLSISEAISRLSKEEFYKQKFEEVFENGLVDSVNLSLALEQFMFSIVSNQSKYDLMKTGEAEFTTQEQRGMDLFFGSFNPDNPQISGAECSSCHGGPNFENDLYMNNGLDTDAEQTDLGRQNVHNYPNLKAKFKVPSLRNIALTQPYMHDGRFNTLLEVINHYDHGVKYSSTVNPTLISIQNQGLQLSELDKQALIAFLHTLTDYPLTVSANYSDPFE